MGKFWDECQRSKDLDHVYAVKLWIDVCHLYTAGSFREKFIGCINMSSCTVTLTELVVRCLCARALYTHRQLVRFFMLCNPTPVPFPGLRVCCGI